MSSTNLPSSAHTDKLKDQKTALVLWLIAVVFIIPLWLFFVVITAYAWMNETSRLPPPPILAMCTVIVSLGVAYCIRQLWQAVFPPPVDENHFGDTGPINQVTPVPGAPPPSPPPSRAVSWQPDRERGSPSPARASEPFVEIDQEGRPISTVFIPVVDGRQPPPLREGGLQHMVAPSGHLHRGPARIEEAGESTAQTGSFDPTKLGRKPGDSGKKR